MITRKIQDEIALLLKEFPAGSLDPRQAGKTTLAEQIAASANPVSFTSYR